MKLSAAFWINIALLIVINTIDILMLERYMGEQWQRETFPMLSHSLRDYGLHTSIWLIRVATYSLVFLLMCLPRSKYVNYFLLTYNLLYWTAMLDWLFVLKVIPSPSP